MEYSYPQLDDGFQVYNAMGSPLLDNSSVWGEDGANSWERDEPVDYDERMLDYPMVEYDDGDHAEGEYYGEWEYGEEEYGEGEDGEAGYGQVDHGEAAYGEADYDDEAADRLGFFGAIEGEDEGEDGGEDEGEGVMGGGVEDEEHEEPERRQQRRPHKPRRPYSLTCPLRQTNWFEASLNWEDNYFRTMYRVSKPTFWSIVTIIQGNPVFARRGSKPQRPVYFQLGVFLLRYGTIGSGERYPMLLTSIGAGTVSLYCRRVIRAIREYGADYIKWPAGERKEEIKAGFKKICGLDGILGALDGTLCGLAAKPRIDGNTYISRKKTLSVTVQAITDHEGKFIAFQSGWAGSRPDCVVWKHMHVYRERRNLFANGEYLLADGGYLLSTYVLMPFNKRELRVDRARRREFNRKISRARIVIEWAFGRLKARFPALTKLGATHKMEDIYRSIEALMILHNLCIDHGDTPEYRRARPDAKDVPQDDPDSEENMDDDEEGLNHDEEGGALQAGRAFRERCVDLICP